MDEFITLDILYTYNEYKENEESERGGGDYE